MGNAGVPKGFLYRREFISLADEAALLHEIERLNFGEFKFRGFLAKRRVVSYGFHYSFDSFKITRAEPVPSFLSPVREKAASWLGCAPEDFSEALITEYPAGSGIGWHRDAAPFDKVVGISLRSLCRIKFRKGLAGKRQTFVVPLEERSAYLLSGEARELWEHHIPVIRALRYSITFRTLKN